MDLRPRIIVLGLHYFRNMLFKVGISVIVGTVLAFRGKPHAQLEVPSEPLRYLAARYRRP